MVALEDLMSVADGVAPPNILELVQLGLATYPPPFLTDAGLEMLEELCDEQERDYLPSP